MLFGTVPTSIPQIIIAANWVLEKDFMLKWQRLKSNTFFWILISFFALHIVGTLYTSNIERGLDDLRNKAPLLVLPILFFSTAPLTQKELKLLFHFFFLSVVVSSIYCFLVYAGFTHKIVIDARQASVFMSHIRFSLFIAFAIIGLVYFFFKEPKWYYKITYVSSLCWLLFFMYKLELATGFVCLVVVGVLLLIGIVLQKLNRRFIIIVFAGSLIVVGILIIKISASFNMFDTSTNNPNNKMLSKSANGRPYLQDTVFQLAENGNLITININDYELNKEWNLKSNLPYNSADVKGNNVRYTILRYMASKGLTKDSVGMKALTTEDVSNIEHGFTNYKYTSHAGLIARWRELVWEYTKYKRGENPSGHTLTMRLEFWKTAIYIIQQHPVFGVGTGDIQDSFHEAYTETHTKLDKAWWLRCHNQYLAVTVAFGVVGLIFFLCYLCYPAIALRKQLHPLYWAFFFIAILSFLTEDTLETQSGVTFFIFFQTLFLWLASFNKNRGLDGNTNAI
jgi:O-antigen ligase